ncbi:hypothetical protein P5V15_000438 [Pogonomyrmex californicus]
MWTKKEEEEEEEKEEEEEEESILTPSSRKQTTPVLDVPSFGKSYCLTQLISTKFDFTWEIKNFVCITKMADRLISPSFPQKSQFIIEMYIIHTEKGNLIHLYLNSKVEFLGSCELHIFYSKTNRMTKLTEMSICSTKRFLKLYEIEEDTFRKYLHTENTITMQFVFENYCKIQNDTVHANVVTSCPIFQNEQIIHKNSILCNDFTSNDIKSITFKIQEEYYTVPIYLLRASNSSFFMNFCDTEKDVDLDELIPDDQIEYLKDILHFFITSSLPDINSYFDYHERLLEIAHKYDVRDVKKICEVYLVDNITIKNVIELAQRALSCDADFLISHIISFIKIHFQKIANSVQFKYLSHEDSNKIMELIKVNETSRNQVVEPILSSTLIYLTQN